MLQMNTTPSFFINQGVNQSGVEQCISSVEVTLKQFAGGTQSAAHLVKALLGVVDGLPVVRADEEPA